VQLGGDLASDQLDLGGGQDGLAAEHLAKRAWGDDLNPGHGQPTPGDGGAVDDQQGDDGYLGGNLEGLGDTPAGPDRSGELLGQRVVAIPEHPVATELEGAAVVLGVDDEHPGRADGQVIDVRVAVGHLKVMQHHIAVAFQAAQPAGRGALAPGAVAPGPGWLGGAKAQPPGGADTCDQCDQPWVEQAGAGGELLAGEGGGGDQGGSPGQPGGPPGQLGGAPASVLGPGGCAWPCLASGDRRARRRQGG
jgi:hypothetical protein